MNLHTRNNNKGFTLIEALVAILILTLGIIPSMAIVVLANNFGASLKNNLIAANLAQEGVEVVRALRDANWLASPVPLPFETGLIGTWRVEWDTNILGSPFKPPQLVGTNPSLKRDSNTGLYNYSTGIDTAFKRTVTVSLVGICACELMVVSEVTWVERGLTQTAAVESHLYDWP